MSKKKWFLITLLTFTNLISVFLTFNFGPYIKQTFIQNNLTTTTSEVKKEEYIEALVKKGQTYQIHIGVLLPESIITGNDEEDSNMAKSFIPKVDQLSYVLSGDLHGERGFVFKGFVYVNDENKLTDK